MQKKVSSGPVHRAPRLTDAPAWKHPLLNTKSTRNDQRSREAMMKTTISPGSWPTWTCCPQETAHELHLAETSPAPPPQSVPVPGSCSTNRSPTTSPGPTPR